MGTTRDIFKWVFRNIAPGEQDPEKRVDAERIMDNYYDARNLVAVVEARGADAADGNSQGLSTTTRCNLTLRTARGEPGLIDAGDFVQITDGTNQWYLRSALPADELSFDDGDLAAGAGPEDYAAPAFIAALIVNVAKLRPKVGRNDLILTGSHPDKLTGADVEADDDDPTPLGKKVGDVKTRVDTSLDGEGRLKTSAVGETTFAADALLGESFENILWGQFDADFDRDGVANGWRKYNTPTCALDAGVYRLGDRSQKIVASQPWDGIVADPDLYTYGDYRGDYVAFSAWVYAAADDSVVLEIADGATTTTGRAGGTAGAWVRLGLEHAVAGAATTLEFRVYADRATTFYVDGAMAKRGRLHPGYAANQQELLRSAMAGEDNANWVLNSDFRGWSNGDDAFPDFWGTGEPFTAPAAVSRDPSHYLFGDAALRLTLGLGQGVFTYLPLVADFRGQLVCASAYILGLSEGGTVRLELADGVNVSYLDVTLDAVSFQRPCLTLRVAPAATMVRLALSNQDAGTVELVVDGVMVGRGGFAAAYKPCAHATPLRWDFAQPGAVASGFLFHEGTNLDIFAVSTDCVIHRIVAYEGTAPSSSYDHFAVTKNGAATALSARLASGQQLASAHVVVAFARGDRIQVAATPSAGPGADAGVVVEGYRFGP